MTLPAAIVLSVLVLAFVFFVAGKLRPDLIAVLVLVSLVLSRVINPQEAFTGFSSFAVMAIAGLMVIGEGLQRTGVVQWVARRLERVIKKKYNRLLLLNTAIPGVLSGFVNIVAAASFFIPVILRLSKQMKVSQSRILLPMACTALIGANLSLIGASHNLVVHSLLEESEGTGFAFFEFTIVGAVLLVAALVYLFFIGQNLLPGKSEAPAPSRVPVTANLIEVYDLEDRIFEVWISEASEESPYSVKDIKLEERGLTLLTLVREGDRLLFPSDEFTVGEGDTLLLQGREEVITELCEEFDWMTFIGPPKGQEKYPISTAELAEAVVPPRSPAVGKTVRELEFIEELGLTPIAYYRENRPVRTGARDTELQEGDSILFYGPRNRLREFDPEKELLVYFKPGKPEVSTKLKQKAPLAAAILVAVILVAALDWFPIAITAIAGAALMLLSGIVEVKRVYDAIDWRTLVLIGGMYPLGIALNSSGAADLIGEALVGTLGGFGPLPLLGGIVVLTIILTQPIHNAAAAIIMTPIAINAAEMVGSNPRAFCVAVVVACSATFLMPYGHPAPLLVQEPGNYRSSDYFRFGIGLEVVTILVILGVVPLIWGL